jgi:hypothetical protein
MLYMTLTCRPLLKIASSNWARLLPWTGGLRPESYAAMHQCLRRGDRDDRAELFCS